MSNKQNDIYHEYEYENKKYIKYGYKNMVELDGHIEKIIKVIKEQLNDLYDFISCEENEQIGRVSQEIVEEEIIYLQRRLKIYEKLLKNDKQKKKYL